MGFHSLQHTRARRSTARGSAQPASFRPQGLITLPTAYSLRAPAGLVSCRRRSWDSPFEAFPSRKVPERYRPNGPTCRSHRRYSLCRSFGPDRRAAAPGLSPSRESLAAGRAVNTPTAGCSHGVRPFQGAPVNASPGISPGLLSRA